jgi:hypothetical protein
MKYTLSLLLVSALSILNAEIEFQDDFEKITPAVGQPVHRMTANDAKIEVVSAPKPEGANKALVIQGGTDEKHDWQPAGDIAIQNGKNGFLYVGFTVKNSSFEPALFGIQLAFKEQPYTYNMWQRLRLYPDRLQISGSGRGLARDKVSAGADAEWMRVEWIVPLPGTKDATPTVSVNGQDQGDFRHEPLTEDLEAINNLRFWLPSLRGEDTQFFVDDVLVITAPTREALEAEVEKANKPELP